MNTLAIDSHLARAFDRAHDNTGHGTAPARVHGRGESGPVAGGEEQHRDAVGRLDGGQRPLAGHYDSVGLH